MTLINDINNAISTAQKDLDDLESEASRIRDSLSDIENIAADLEDERYRFEQEVDKLNE